MSSPAGFFREDSKTRLRHAPKRRKRKVVVPDIEFEWYEDIRLDFYGEFDGGRGMVKAQRGGNNSRDFYMEPPRGSPEWSRLFIEEIWVEPERQGYGTMLMRALEKEARRKGIDELGAEVTEDAVPFLGKMSWEPSTDPPTWEETNWGRALAMFKDLA